MDEAQCAFFEDLAQISDSVHDAYVRVLAGGDEPLSEEALRSLTVLREQLDPVGQAAFASVLRAALLTALHSAMVIFAGGTRSASVVSLEIVKDDGEPLVPHGGYHELFVEHLFETGRET